MIVQDIINQLEDLAPLAYAEEFDNVGHWSATIKRKLQEF